MMLKSGVCLSIVTTESSHAKGGGKSPYRGRSRSPGGGGVSALCAIKKSGHWSGGVRSVKIKNGLRDGRRTQVSYLKKRC